MAARRTPLLGSVALLMGTVVLLAVIGETGARLLWSDPRGERAPRPRGEWAELPVLGGLFELMGPNVRGTTAGVLFETNRFGFRGRERSVEKPPDVYRIALIGDSVAMGWGVLEEETYAGRLEHGPGLGPESFRYEVLNFAVSGLNTHWAVDRLARLGLRFDPDLVIYGFTLNDIEGPSYRRSREEGLEEPFAHLDSRSYLWRFLGGRWVSIRELFWAPRGSYVYELDDNYFRNPAAWSHLIDALDRLEAILRRRGSCGVVFIHARLHFLHAFHPFERIYDRVAIAASERGFHVVHSLPDFRGRNALSLWVNRADPHPNAEGHRLLAESLRKGLRELPATCWERRDRTLSGRDAS